MKDKFSIDYDKKELVIAFEGETFTFDLTEGDTGEFWHSFTMKDGTIKDINFYQEDYDETPSVSIYGVEEDEDGKLLINTNDEILIQEHTVQGNPFNYFDWHKKTVYLTICNDHHGHDEIDGRFDTEEEAKARFEELKKTSSYCRYEKVEVVGEDAFDNNDTIESYYLEDESCPNCGDEDNIWKNSSGEIQCDNCGFDESNEEKYTVWVGGVPDVENVSKEEAEVVAKEWRDKGYDDVIIEAEGGES